MASEKTKIDFKKIQFVTGVFIISVGVIVLPCLIFAFDDGSSEATAVVLEIPEVLPVDTNSNESTLEGSESVIEVEVDAEDTSEISSGEAEVEQETQTTEDVVEEITVEEPSTEAEVVVQDDTESDVEDVIKNVIDDAEAVLEEDVVVKTDAMAEMKDVEEAVIDDAETVLEEEIVVQENIESEVEKITEEILDDAELPSDENLVEEVEVFKSEAEIIEEKRQELLKKELTVLHEKKTADFSVMKVMHNLKTELWFEDIGGGNLQMLAGEEVFAEDAILGFYDNIVFWYSAEMEIVAGMDIFSKACFSQSAEPSGTTIMEYNYKKYKVSNKNNRALIIYGVNEAN